MEHRSSHCTQLFHPSIPLSRTYHSRPVRLASNVQNTPASNIGRLHIDSSGIYHQKQTLGPTYHQCSRGHRPPCYSFTLPIHQGLTALTRSPVAFWLLHNPPRIILADPSFGRGLAGGRNRCTVKPKRAKRHAKDQTAPRRAAPTHHTP